MRPPARLVQINLAFLIATLLHDADHIRQGRPLTMAVHVLGAVAVGAAVASLALAVLRHRLAPLAGTLVGVGAVIVLPLVHVVPHWSALSDPYPAARVDAFSWLVLVLLIAAGAVLAAAGLGQIRTSPEPFGPQVPAAPRS